MHLPFYLAMLLPRTYSENTLAKETKQNKKTYPKRHMHENITAVLFVVGASVGAWKSPASLQKE